ncbi:MAG: DUF2125 domain-containing protein [Asticcacaulis sp.]|nr:DUF2125 domain-containing protein [Asticcacaulis sp.]
MGLFGPFVAVVVLAIVWSGYWFYVAHEVEKRIAAHQTTLIQHGYQVSFDPVHVRGYPYRMFVEMKNLTVVAPNGKGFATPDLQAEANAYALDKWVMVAPQGLTLYRGRIDGYDLGKITVSGRSLRASVSGLSKPVYNVAVEGSALTLVPSDPTHPFAFTTADKFDAYLRPTHDVADSADFLMRISGAHGQPQSFIGDMSPEKPLSLSTEGVLNHFAAFNGGGFKAWAQAGGTATGVKSQVTAGDLGVIITGDGLSADSDNHLTGKLKIEMSGTFKPLDVLGALRVISPENMTLAKPLLNMTLATQGTQAFTIEFHDGSAWIGPLKVSDAPILP